MENCSQGINAKERASLFKRCSFGIRQRFGAVYVGVPTHLSAVFSFIMPVILSVGFVSPVLAEIYRWQDDEGNWHFTDAPVEKAGVSVQPDYGVESTQSKDLETLLIEKLSPNGPIENAMLSTVSIQSALGKGAGFFINDEGYIVTLLNVIRPDREGAQRGDRVSELKKQLDVAREDYLYEKGKIKPYREEVEALKAKRVLVSGRKRDAITEQLESVQKEYSKQRAESRRSERIYRDIRVQFEREQTEKNIRLNRAKVDQAFSIYLKDGSKYMAEIVKIDKKSGLALLRIEGYITPRLYMDEAVRPSLGMSLFLLNAVGAEHALTPVTVLGLKGGKVTLDGSIAYDMRGAPLVDAQGRLVAIGQYQTRSDVGSGQDAHLLMELFADFVW